LQARTREGRAMQVTVVGVDDTRVKLDGNHPLAGKDLVFDVELVEIVQAA
jgi:peptidylprolyl isomerase